MTINFIDWKVCDGKNKNDDTVSTCTEEMWDVGYRL